MDKELYVITVELDEDSEYFAELTEMEAAQLRRILTRSRHKYSVTQVKSAPGFNSFEDLKNTLMDMA